MTSLLGHMLLSVMCCLTTGPKQQISVTERCLQTVSLNSFYKVIDPNNPLCRRLPRILIHITGLTFANESKAPTLQNLILKNCPVPPFPAKEVFLREAMITWLSYEYPRLSPSLVTISETKLHPRVAKIIKEPSFHHFNTSSRHYSMFLLWSFCTGPEGNI